MGCIGSKQKENLDAEKKGSEVRGYSLNLILDKPLLPIVFEEDPKWKILLEGNKDNFKYIKDINDITFKLNELQEVEDITQSVDNCLRIKQSADMELNLQIQDVTISGEVSAGNWAIVPYTANTPAPAPDL